MFMGFINYLWLNCWWSIEIRIEYYPTKCFMIGFVLMSLASVDSSVASD